MWSDSIKLLNILKIKTTKKSKHKNKLNILLEKFSIIYCFKINLFWKLYLVMNFLKPEKNKKNKFLMLKIK
jgi:hypothetical protein